MPEKIEELVRAALKAAQEAGELAEFDVPDCGIERPADTSHGEWTSTVALRSAKLAPHRAPKRGRGHRSASAAGRHHRPC